VLPIFSRNLLQPTAEISDTPTSDALKSFLLELFKRLEIEQVVYCILRNYEILPEFIGNDIDILVHPKDKNRFENCLTTAAEMTGWMLLKNPRRFGYRAYWFKSNVEREFIHFDVWSLIHWKGLRWLDEKAVLRKRRPYKQYYIPDSIHKNCILLIKDLIQIGIIKDKYKKTIQSALLKQPVETIYALEWGIGERLARDICNSVKKNDWEWIQSLKRVLHQKVFLRELTRNPVKAIFGILNYLTQYIWSGIVRPSGYFVALIGPDGSGKSTVANGIMASMNKIFPNPAYFHGRFEILPELIFFVNYARKLFKKPMIARDTGISASHVSSKPFSLIRALFYMLYYSLDYFLGYLIIYKVRSQGGLIIFDRYFYDYFIQFKYMKLHPCLLDILILILPKPDLVVYLENSPTKIYQRKKELTLDEINQQGNRCKQIIKIIPNAMTLDTNQSVLDIVHRIENNIILRMVKRIHEDSKYIAGI